MLWMLWYEMRLLDSILRAFAGSGIVDVKVDYASLPAFRAHAVGSDARASTPD